MRVGALAEDTARDASPSLDAQERGPHLDVRPQHGVTAAWAPEPPGCTGGSLQKPYSKGHPPGRRPVPGRGLLGTGPHTR